jgi:hypothetical protein
MHSRKKISLKLNSVYFFWGLMFLITVSIFLYGYFVNTTILYATQKQELEGKIIEKRTEISQLELNIIESNRNLTEEYANELGLYSIENKDLVFVKKSSGAKLSLNEL